MQLVEPVRLLLGAAGNELRRKELTKGRVLLSPAMAREGQHRRALFPFRGGSSALRPADAIAAVQNQMRHSLRMAHGIADRYRASLRDAEQGEAFETGGIHHGFEIADECLKRDFFDFTVREAVAACVVANKRVVARQFAIEMPRTVLSRER